jgi:hypothetical protein
MENVRTLDQKLETVAWAAFFIWWGITELVQSLPPGIGAIGIGVILLGLNAARQQNGLPASGFTIILGILAIVWGGLELAGVLLHLSVELPVFAILLVVLGVTMLGRSLIQNKSE